MPVTWSNLKKAIADQFPVAHDVLHVHFGLAIFLGIAALYRFTRRGLVVGWVALLALELANELLDLSPWGGSIAEATCLECGKDLVNTMLWPTLLLAILWHLARNIRDEAQPIGSGERVKALREPDVSGL